MISRWCQIAALGGALTAAAQATDFLSEAERLLSQNKPGEAVTYLEATLGQGRLSQRLFLYLGTAYHALGQNDRAVAMFERGLELRGELKAALLYNLGSVSMARRDYEKAEAYLSRALELDERDGDAYLNRANVRLIRENYEGALNDYLQVLALQPDNPQRAQILRLTELLRAHLAAVREAQMRAEAERLAQLAREEEARREAERLAALQEEERRRQEELARQEEERRRQEEERRLAEENRRREELLARIRESLARAAEEARNLQAPEGSIRKTEEELDLAR